MLLETTLTEAQVGLADLPAARSPLLLPLRAGWILGKFVLAGLLLTYLVGWAQDLHRVRRLEAEPPPPLKVITKYQAWERIHRPAARKVVWSQGTLPSQR